MNRDGELTEEELERIADRVVERLGSINVHQHVKDHTWVRQQILREEEFRDSRRRVIERIVGAVGTAGVLFVLGWIGSQIIDQVGDWGVKAIQKSDQIIGGNK